MIKTVIFDIGNVLCGFHWKEYFEGFGYDKEMIKKLETATVSSPIWLELDRGCMTDAEILDAFVANDPSIEKEIRQSLTNTRGLLVRYDYAIPWIQELKSKGYQVLVLSNFNHKAHTECQDATDFLPYVDGGILSYLEKCVKPEPVIYEKLIAKCNLIPQECVFLDDVQQNLDGAAAFGIHTILFRDQEQAKEDLRKLGVE